MNAPAEVVGRRLLAGLVDLVVLVVVMIVVGVAFGEGHSGHGQAGVSLHGTAVLVWIVLALAYYGIFEAMFGWTLGKLVVRLRVIAVGGDRASPRQVTTRTILRVIDFLPFMYLVGLVAMLASGRRAARIGDLAANTSVVAVPARSATQDSTVV